MAAVEWDTLLFFYGVMMCVGALGLLGYLAMISHLLYGVLGPTAANVLIGIASAILDNIPLMFAVLTMQPDMSHGQWLLVTLTAGVGGSLLSIGSAAGVAIMGQARGTYTFAVPSALDAGGRARLRRQHRHPPGAQPRRVLTHGRRPPGSLPILGSDRIGHIVRTCCRNARKKIRLICLDRIRQRSFSRHQRTTFGGHKVAALSRSDVCGVREFILP